MGMYREMVSMWLSYFKIIHQQEETLSYPRADPNDLDLRLTPLKKDTDAEEISEFKQKANHWKELSFIQTLHVARCKQRVVRSNTGSIKPGYRIWTRKQKWKHGIYEK